MARAQIGYEEAAEQGVLVTLVRCLETLRAQMSGGGFEADALAIIAAGMIVRRQRGQKQKGAIALVNAARAYLATRRGPDHFEHAIKKMITLSDSTSLDVARDHAVSLFELLNSASRSELELTIEQVAKSSTGHAAGWETEAHALATEKMRARLTKKLPRTVDELMRWAFGAAGKGTWLNAKDSASRKRKSRAKRRKLVTSANVSK